MVIYIDLVIISTIITDYSIIKIMAEVWNEKVKFIKLLVGLFISVLILCLFIFPLKHLMVLRYFSGVLVPLICFDYKSIKDTIIKVITYYILNILYIGIIVVFNIETYFMLLVSLFLVVLSFVIENYKNITIKENASIVYVSINKVKYRAYLDTGNMMYYDGIPIVIIRNKLFDCNIYKYISNLKIKCLGSSADISVYSGPPLNIDNIEYIVYYTFNNIDFDIILHKDCR